MPIRARPSSRAALVLAAALTTCAAQAAPAVDRPAVLKEQRGDLRKRIASLRRELASTEESRSSAADAVKEAESAISDLNRRLQRLAEQRQQVRREAEELNRQSRHLQDRTAAQQAQLSRLLRQRYTRDTTDALQILLAGQDPNQAAVDRHLLTVLARATADLIADLRRKGHEKSLVAEAARRKADELAQIEDQQQQGKEALVERQQQRQKLLAQLAEQIRSQRRELGTLQRDEKRLGRLIAGLTRIVRQPDRRRPAVQPPPGVRPDRQPEPMAADSNFARLRGRLALPVRGDIAGRFGGPRPEGGTTWKGLYIRAAEGTPVHAVASGQIVFADWLRGFGNLLVIDHGDDFLSVYGHNQSLLRETGDSVQAGEVVATVGASGGSQESGLYFELRHQGRAFDPLRWVGLR